MPGGRRKADPITVTLITHQAHEPHFFRGDALQEPSW